jgi:P-type E1-E2 ATPase
MLSGDAQAAVQSIGERCGLPRDKLVAEASPEAKCQFVAALAHRGRRVMMVGDGINDAAALAAADVGVAVSGGVDLALASAAVFLGRPGIAPVAQLVDFARYTRTSLRLLLGLSALYNVVAVTLAITGVMHPLVAAAIMPLAP